MTFLRFPEGFRFGLSTSAHQIEGYSTADGGGRSIWDHFAHTEGTTQDGDTADVACDHYHRWREDIGLMEQARPHRQGSGDGRSLALPA